MSARGKAIKPNRTARRRDEIFRSAPRRLCLSGCLSFCAAPRQPCFWAVVFRSAPRRPCLGGCLLFCAAPAVFLSGCLSFCAAPAVFLGGCLSFCAAPAVLLGGCLLFCAAPAVFLGGCLSFCAAPAVFSRMPRRCKRSPDFSQKPGRFPTFLIFFHLWVDKAV